MTPWGLSFSEIAVKPRMSTNNAVNSRSTPPNSSDCPPFSKCVTTSFDTYLPKMDRICFLCDVSERAMYTMQSTPVNKAASGRYTKFMSTPR